MTTMTNEIRPTAGLRRTFARRLLLLLLLLTAGAGGAWGQATYTYIVGEDITQAPDAGATVTSVPGITMTWGTTNSTGGYDPPTFSYQTGGTAPSSAFTTNYVLGGNTWPKTSDKSDPSDSYGAPYYGCYLKFTATAAGTLTLGLYDGSTTSSVTLMTVDGSDKKTVTAHLEGGSVDSYTGSFTYSVTTVSGYTYYLYVPGGTEIGLFGFAFTPAWERFTHKSWDFTTIGSSHADKSNLFTGETVTINSLSCGSGVSDILGLAAQGNWLLRTSGNLQNSEAGPRILSVLDCLAGDLVTVVCNDNNDASNPCYKDDAITNSSVGSVTPTSGTYVFTVSSDGNFWLQAARNAFIKSIQVNRISNLRFSTSVATYTIGTSDLTALPLLTNKGVGSVTYSSTNDAVVREGFGRVKGPGVAYLTATSTDGSTASCKFVVTANEATATNTGSTFTFTGNGLYRGSSLVELNGMTMRLGNGSEALVVENKSEAGGLAVKVMDGNGYFFRIADETPPTMGTVYRLRVETEGTFTATGYFTANTKLINSSGTNQTFSYSGTSLTATLTSGIYYLYNDSGSDADVLWLHSFGFTPNTFVTVGQSQYWFIPTLTNATFTVTDGASLLSIEHGVVKINQSFTAFDDYGYAYGTVHAVYENSTTEDFRIRVKRDEWDIATNNAVDNVSCDFGDTEYQPWDAVPVSKGLQFQGNWAAYNNTAFQEGNHMLYMMSNAKLRIPTLPGQTLNFKTTQRSGGTYNFWVSQTNLVSGDFYSKSDRRIRNAGDKSFTVGSGSSVTLTMENNNNSRCYVKLVNTYYPTNPAASSSFPNSEHSMYQRAGYRSALTVTGTDPAAKTVFYYSENTSIAEVDPWTGNVNTLTPGDVVIHARPLGVVGTYNGSAADITYTLHVVAKPVSEETIVVSDLYLKNETNADAGLDRTIPKFQLNFSGRDGLKVKNNGASLNFRSTNAKGQLEIEPRLTNSNKKVLFTEVTLTTPTVTEGRVSVNGYTTTVNSSTSTIVTLSKSATALATSMYHVWSGVEADATIASDPSPAAELQLNTSLEKGNTVYGYSTVPALYYADLTGYNKIVFTGTPGVVLRLLFNRVSDTGDYITLYTEIDENGTATVDLSTLTYAHLNAVKLDWSSPSGQITAIQLEGGGVPRLVIRYNGSDNDGFMLSQLSFKYQAEGDDLVETLLDATKVKPGLGFEKSTVFADGTKLAANTATFSTLKNFTGSLTFASANTDVATVSNTSTGDGTMKTDDFEQSTAFTGTFAGSAYFAAETASYTVKGTLSIPVKGTKELLGVKAGQEIELIAFTDEGETTVTLDNTVGSLADNTKAPLGTNLVLNIDGEPTSLGFTTATATYYAYAKANGPVTLTNTGSKPIRLLSFHAYYRETKNTVNYKKYSGYAKYDDFEDAATPFVYAGGFSLPTPALHVVDVKSGEDVSSLYTLSPYTYACTSAAVNVNTGTGVLASSDNMNNVQTIQDVSVTAGMQTVGAAYGYEPTITASGSVRVYPYAMTWNFPTNASTEGLQFTGNHAVELVGGQQRLDIVGNVVSSVMIPVQKRQKVVVTAHAYRNDTGKGGSQIINLRNAGDIYEETASQTTYNSATVDYEYTALEDGYLTLKNITREYHPSGRTLSIRKIVVKPQELLFADGFTVPIAAAPGAGAAYQNPIINPMDDDVTYTYTIEEERLAAGATFNTATGVFTASTLTGKVFDENQLGDLVVSVAASKGDLVHEQTGSYTLQVLTYNFQNQEVNHVNDGSGWTVTQLDNPLMSSYSPIPVPNTIYYEKIEGNPTVKINFDGESTNYSVTLTGLGKVRIVAESGVITTSFTMESTPGTTTPEFRNTMPSVKAGTTSFSQPLEGGGEGAVEWSVLKHTNHVTYVFDTGTGEFANISGWGVITVQAKKGDVTKTYTLTVQRPLSETGSYTEQSTGETWSYHYYTWDFHSDWLHKYVQEVKNNMNGTYISDDLENLAAPYETADWKWFQRKESNTGDKSEYIYFYRHDLQGDNGFVIPETIGLQIESSACTRTAFPHKEKGGFGIINIAEKRGTGELSATPGTKMALATPKVNPGLSLQEGVTLTIPKLKAGWYVEVQWARLDPTSGVNIQTSNLKDLNGNLINSTLKIDRCQDNLANGGYYTFQVVGDPTDAADYRDVSFTVLPEGYDNLYQIRVYDGAYQETMLPMKVGQDEKEIATLDINDPTSPMKDYMLLYDDARGAVTVNFTYANNLGSPVAPSRVNITTEGPLKAEMSYSVSHVPLTPESTDREHGYYPFPTVQLEGGYGRFYVNYTLYSDDRKYVINRKSYRLKVGLVPHQDYPYTWNFTNISSGEVLTRQTNALNSVVNDYETWTGLGNNTYKLNVNTKSDTYYVPGSTLIASGLNLGAKGTKAELDAAGQGCDEFNGLGITGSIAFRGYAQDGMESLVETEPAAESYPASTSLLSCSMNNLTAVNTEQTAGEGKVKLGSSGKLAVNYSSGEESDKNHHVVGAADGDKRYQMDGGVSKHILLIPKRPFLVGDVITFTGYAGDNTSDKPDGTNYGFGFYANGNNTTDPQLCHVMMAPGEAWTKYTVSYTVREGDGIAGRSQIYVYRAVSKKTVFLMEVSVTSPSEATTYTTHAHKLYCKEAVTITIPDLNADSKQDWIYIESSAAPTTISNATSAVDADGLDAAAGVYKYKVTAPGNCEATFASDTKISRIGVTHILKPITEVGDEGWATESRDHAIDHHLTGVLTKNDVNAYTVSVKSSTDRQATVKLDAVNDDASGNANRAVPAETGVVLRLNDNTNLSKANSDRVPLFYPSMTTSTVSFSDMKFAGNRGNRMMPSVDGKSFAAETEMVEGTEYTPFVLAKRYATWSTKKVDDAAAVLTPPDHFESREAAVFYRLHVFDADFGGDPPGVLNALDANKAYLLLATSTLPPALWENTGSSRQYVGILGVSDMAEAEQVEPTERSGDGRIYDLHGQVVDGGHLRPGIYIRGGRKFVVR